MTPWPFLRFCDLRSQKASRMTGVTRLIDMVFPGDANHHGTLFGGVALAHMDKVAFIAAARHGHVGFVTASCERIDFTAPAHIGEMVEFTGEIVRVGRRSLGVQVDMVAEALLSGERRLCTRGLFNMVAVKPEGGWPDDFRLPETVAAAEPETDGELRMVELVLPGRTDHGGKLFGGDALSAMGKAAFIVATRHARQAVVMASSHQIDFVSPILTGETTELVGRVRRVGRSSMTVEVELWAENMLTGERRRSATAGFVMVALGPDGRPIRVPPLP